MNYQYLQTLKLPESPGVYTFRDERKRPLYIGRATSLRDRLKSYFADDLIETRGPRIVDMVTKASNLTWQETGSVLEAVILESALIKQYQPFYNIDEKDDKSSQYVVITNEDWPRVFLARARDLEAGLKAGDLPYKVKKYFGPFPHSGVIKEALKILRRLFPFRDKKASDPRHEAFYRALGMSPNRDEEAAHEKYLMTVSYLIMFFEGKQKQLRRSIEKEMKSAAKDMRFEEADQAKRLLYALDHINDISLIKRQNGHSGTGFRIEAYDIAHLSGTDVVGAMVVSVGGQFAPSEYRRFKIFKDANNDTANLAEVLFRRLNHTEWSYPDLIIVDGNEVQAKNAENVLKARRVAMPVVAVTKDERHRASRLVGNAELIKKYEKDIIALNYEAHRFAVAYHRIKRSKKLPQ